MCSVDQAAQPIICSPQHRESYGGMVEHNLCSQVLCFDAVLERIHASTHTRACGTDQKEARLHILAVCSMAVEHMLFGTVFWVLLKHAIVVL